MFVLHANWSHGGFHLWGESLEEYHALWKRRVHDSAAVEPCTSNGAMGRHPYALESDDLHQQLHACIGTRNGLLGKGNILAAGTALELKLPESDGLPLPSAHLCGYLDEQDTGDEVRLGHYRVPAVAMENVHALLLLQVLEVPVPGSAFQPSTSLGYWARVARLVLDLLRTQQFIPTLVQNHDAGLHAAWHPWLHESSIRVELGRLMHEMPPVVRAGSSDRAAHPWPILTDAIEMMTNATVRRTLVDEAYVDSIDGYDHEDPHVVWLRALLDHADEVDVSVDHGSRLLRDVTHWIAELHDQSRERGIRLGCELLVPDDEPASDVVSAGEDCRWRLRFFASIAGEPPVRLDMQQIWDDPTVAEAGAGGRLDQLEETILSELRRAGRICPLLERALLHVEPVEISLTTGEASAWLTEYQQLLSESGFDIVIPEWWGKPASRLSVRIQVDSPSMEEYCGDAVESGSASTKPGLNSMVEYRWQLMLGDQPISLQELAMLQAIGGSGIRLLWMFGRWVEVHWDEVEEAASHLLHDPDGKMTLLSVLQLMHGVGSSSHGLVIQGIDATGWVSDFLAASGGDAALPILDVPTRFHGTLRPYQVIGLSWLVFLDRLGLGGCLADDMGLGKTIQLITLLLWEREHPPADEAIGPTLLVVPTSLIRNWKRELFRFAPSLHAYIHHGPDRLTGKLLADVVGRHDVVITTYSLVSRDRDILEEIPWYRVVLDEAQYIKNPPTKQAVAIRSLPTTRRIALTGTPVENRLTELWSIMEFCNPGCLGTSNHFRRHFSIPIERHRNTTQGELLRDLVRPFILRRLKTDPKVINDLPPCVTTREYATMTREQASLYQETVDAMLGDVGNSEGIRRRGLVLATLVKLKQICNHPAQFGAENPGGTVASLASRSGKCRRLLNLLEELTATGAKALIFTQFRRMGHLLQSMIEHELKVETQFLHGGTPVQKRQDMIDRYQDPGGGVPIFILSLKAGGIGLNLTEASHVFHFDRWWNPAVENQATDRAFRIGQTRTVHVHKFISLGTLEEQIDRMIEQKTTLAQNIVGSGEEWLTEMSLGQLRDVMSLRESGLQEDDH